MIGCVPYIGNYPHPDVPCVPKTVKVQREICYCPDLKFIAYDVAVTHGTDRGRYIEDLIHNPTMYVSVLTLGSQWTETLK